jgi:hypothetical protein
LLTFSDEGVQQQLREVEGELKKQKVKEDEPTRAATGASSRSDGELKGGGAEIEAARGWEMFFARRFTDAVAHFSSWLRA